MKLFVICIHGVLNGNNNANIYFIGTYIDLVLTVLNEGAYLTFKSIFHKALNFSSIVISRSNPFLEPTIIKQEG